MVSRGRISGGLGEQRHCIIRMLAGISTKKGRVTCMERRFLSLKNGGGEASMDILRCLFGRLLPIAQKTGLEKLNGGFL